MVLVVIYAVPRSPFFCGVLCLIGFCVRERVCAEHCHGCVVIVTCLFVKTVPEMCRRAACETHMFQSPSLKV